MFILVFFRPVYLGLPEYVGIKLRLNTRAPTLDDPMPGPLYGPNLPHEPANILYNGKQNLTNV